MKTNRFLLLAFTLLCAGSFAQTSHETVVELMKVSGFTTIFQQFEGIVDAQIVQKKSTFKSEEDFNKFANVMKSGLNPKSAEAYFMEYYEQNTNEDSIRNVIRLYEQPFMQEMQKIELAANNPSRQQEMLAYMQGLNANPASQERTQQLVTLNKELGTSEMTIKMVKNMIYAMAKGLNNLQPKDKQILQSELEQKISSSLPAGFSEQIANSIVTVYLFTYKDLSDDQLNAYISICQSPTGRYSSKHTLQALDYSFSKMGEIIGNSFKVFVK